MSLEEELDIRAEGIDFLFRIGATLHVNMNAVATGAMFFHRFYMRYSLKDFEPREMAGTCFFLACKVEECGRKLRTIASTCVVKALKTEKIEEHEADVVEWEEKILKFEEILLDALCFDLVVDQAHGFLCDALDELSVTGYQAELAWSITSDSYRTALCVLCQPHIIACAAYLLSIGAYSDSDIPSLDDHLARFSSEPWRAAFCLSENDVASLTDALQMLLDFYKVTKSPNRLPKIQSPSNARRLSSSVPEATTAVKSSPPTTHENGSGSRNGVEGLQPANEEPDWA